MFLVQYAGFSVIRRNVLDSLLNNRLPLYLQDIRSQATERLLNIIIHCKSTIFAPKSYTLNL